jgi:hypothetical protein
MWWPPPPCAGYLAHPFSTSMMLLLIYSFFSELWHSLMKECKRISCVSIHHADIGPVHPLLQGETRGWKFLSGASKTRWYAQLNLFRYDGLTLEALRPLFGSRGVTHYHWNRDDLITPLIWRHGGDFPCGTC